MSSCKSLISSLLILAVLSLSAQQSQARLISTEQVLNQVSLQEKRQQISTFLQRSDIEQQFSRLGLSASETHERLGALTDDEVVQITERLDTLPAGQDGFGSVLGVMLIVFIILLVTDIMHLTKVFPFTR